MCLCNEFNSIRVANKHISESESESEVLISDDGDNNG